MLETGLVIGIASFAITYIVKYTDGPWSVFSKFRRRIQLELPVYDDDKIVDYHENDPDTFISKLVACFWCFTTWVAVVLTIAYILIDNYSLWQFVFIWFCAVGVSGFLYEYIEM